MPKTSTTLADTIARDLALRIVRGFYPEGGALPGENELAQQYGASRTSVRHALQLLAAKGLLSIQAKRRSTVTARDEWHFLDAVVLQWLEEVGIGPEVMEQLMVTRLMVEPDAAALAASAANGRDLAALEDAWLMMSQGQQQNALALFEQGDLAFHAALLKACHNPFLLSIGNALSTALPVSFKQTQEEQVALAAEAVEQHRLLLEAIRLRQSEQARQRMRDILLSAAARHLWKSVPEKYRYLC